MLDDALRLSVDLLFANDSEKTKQYESKFPVTGYSNNESVYEYLGNIVDKN